MLGPPPPSVQYELQLSVAVRERTALRSRGRWVEESGDRRLAVERHCYSQGGFPLTPVIGFNNSGTGDTNITDTPNWNPNFKGPAVLGRVDRWSIRRPLRCRFRGPSGTCRGVRYEDRGWSTSTLRCSRSSGS